MKRIGLKGTWGLRKYHFEVVHISRNNIKKLKNGKSLGYVDFEYSYHSKCDEIVYHIHIAH